MNTKIKSRLAVGLALCMMMAAGPALAAVTVNATTVSGDAALTLTGALASTWSTAAGDITIEAGTTTAASVILLSNQNAADAVYLHADGGISDGVYIRSDQGTGVASIHLLSDVGGVTVDTSGGNGEIRLTTGTADVVLAGSASGVDVLTLTAGDILLTAGHFDMTVGDVTLADGSVNVIDADNAASLSVTNATASTYGAAVDNGVVQFIGDGLTTGTLLHLSVTEGTLANGFYLRAWDETGDSAVLTVGENGATVIAGSASGTDALTLTAGDITQTSGDLTLTLGNAVLTAGNIDMNEGKIEVDTTTNETSYVKRNLTGATSAAVEIEITHAADTGSALLVDNNGTSTGKGIEISHDGDGAAIDISAGAARTGNVININMANALAETAIDISGATTGTNGEGIIHVDVTGVLAGNAIRVDSTGANAATGQLIYATSTGAQAGATNGIVAYFTDTGAAAATSYTVYIASTNNEALHVDTGTVVVDETVSAAAYKRTVASALTGATALETADIQLASVWPINLTAAVAVTLGEAAVYAAGDVGRELTFAITTGHATNALTVVSGTAFGTITTNNIDAGASCEELGDMIECLITSTSTAICRTYCAD